MLNLGPRGGEKSVVEKWGAIADCKERTYGSGNGYGSKRKQARGEGEAMCSLGEMTARTEGDCWSDGVKLLVLSVANHS